MLKGVARELVIVDRSRGNWLERGFARERE